MPRYDSSDLRQRLDDWRQHQRPPIPGDQYAPTFDIGKGPFTGKSRSLFDEVTEALNEYGRALDSRLDPNEPGSKAKQVNEPVTARKLANCLEKFGREALKVLDGRLHADALRDRWTELPENTKRAILDLASNRNVKPRRYSLPQDKNLALPARGPRSYRSFDHLFADETDPRALALAALSISSSGLRPPPSRHKGGNGPDWPRTSKRGRKPELVPVGIVYIPPNREPHHARHDLVRQLAGVYLEATGRNPSRVGSFRVLVATVFQAGKIVDVGPDDDAHSTAERAIREALKRPNRKIKSR